MTDSTVVYVVDDDASTRKSMNRLIRSCGYEVKTFECAEAFLDMSATQDPSCLVLDIRMPGLSGLELQERLSEIENDIPIIFVTGHGTVRDSVRAIKGGAVEMLEKPFEERALIDAIETSIKRAEDSKSEREEMKALRHRVRTLTPREYEIFEHVVRGMLNKQIARKLGISEKTVKVHRGRVMEKMQVEFLAQLVRMAARLGIPAR